ncbi:MAG: hypothetical protein O3A14_20425 [Cyanobacteria bacterium]|nr:hypothetical protein [Cyanobacteriota bacterium]
MATPGLVLSQYSAVLGMVATLEILRFLLKLLVPSLLLAIAIRVGGPQLSIPATATVSLILVLTPSVVMGGFLGYRLWHSNGANHAHPGRD